MFDGWLRIDEDRPYSVSEFIAHCNTQLSREFDDILIEGEVASFKINQGRWVFFDLKEDDHSVNCFLPLARLSVALTDGMKVQLRATPKITAWGKFSLTVRQILPIGEGNIKKSFELLKKKLTAEGVFDPAKKRPLPDNPTKIGVISSTGAAGYVDFLKILDNRWGGLEIKTINTQVQGIAAPEQIIRALEYFNQHNDVEVIAILRGGGSADDLAAFNDEALARTIAASKIPVITGIGHEVDESLADLAADVRASTPSNAAERLSRDRAAISSQLKSRLLEARRQMLGQIDFCSQQVHNQFQHTRETLLHKIELVRSQVSETVKVLDGLNPETILRHGYAIISGRGSPGMYQVNDHITITTDSQILIAEIQNAQKR